MTEISPTNISFIKVFESLSISVLENIEHGTVDMIETVWQD